MKPGAKGSAMKRLCDCGCRRPARTEWIHPNLGSFWFGALCNIRNRHALELAGFMEFADLGHEADKPPLVTIVGTSADFDD